MIGVLNSKTHISTTRHSATNSITQYLSDKMEIIIIKKNISGNFVLSEQRLKNIFRALFKVIQTWSIFVVIKPSYNDNNFACGIFTLNSLVQEFKFVYLSQFINNLFRLFFSVSIIRNLNYSRASILIQINKVPLVNLIPTMFKYFRYKILKLSANMPFLGRMINLDEIFDFRLSERTFNGFYF